MADKSSLARATDSSTSPTPGYLYVDITKSVSSSPNACSETIQYLQRRLSKNNGTIKFKTLKIFQIVSMDKMTRGSFKRAVAMHHSCIASIKECLNFRGPPDAVHGDELYAKVRNQARDTLDAVYSDTPSSDNIGGGGGMAPQYEGQGAGGGGGGGYGNGNGDGGGYGNGNNGGGGGGGGYGAPQPQQQNNVNNNGPRKMEGIGNPMFRNSSGGYGGSGTGGEQSIIATVAEGFKGIINDPLARKVGLPNADGGNNNGSYQGGGGGGYGGGGGGGYSGNGGGGGGGGGYGGSSQYNNVPPGQSQLSQSTQGQWTMASNRGPNAVGGVQRFGNDSYQRDKTGGRSGSEGGGGNGNGGFNSWSSESQYNNNNNNNQTSISSQARINNNNTNTNANSGPSQPPSSSYNNNNGVLSGANGSAASDGSYERNLIMELCPPGGMKAEPPPEKMKAFTLAVPHLDADLVCPALLDQLEDGQPWIIRAKALCVMEVTINVAEENRNDGTMEGNNKYADFFYACEAEISPLAKHTRLAVREPAKRVLRALGLDEPPAAAPAATAATDGQVGNSGAAHPQSIEPPVDLLDFGGGPALTSSPPDVFSAGVPPTTAPPPPPAVVAAIPAIPTEMPPSVPSMAPPAVPPPPPPSSPQVPVTTSTTNTSEGGALFGGMQMKQTSSATTHPTSVAPVVTAAVVATSVPAAAAAENMFNNPIVATTEGTENATPPAVEVSKIIRLKC